MLNSEEQNDENKIEFYSTLKEILNWYSSVLYTNSDTSYRKKFEQEITTFLKSIKEHNVDKIFQRIKAISTEVVYDKAFLLYAEGLRFLSELHPKMIKSSSHEKQYLTSNFKFLQSGTSSSLISIDVDYPKGSFESFMQEEPALRSISSTIISHKSIYTSEGNDGKFLPKKTKHLQKIFIYEHFFLWFRDYFELYTKTMTTIMNEDGYIQKQWRFYIAIMAVSAIKCGYLLQILEELFLEVGGDEAWLVYGLDVVPEKLKKLSRINNILAHQPWILTSADLKELNTPNEKGFWNLNELMQAALILIQFNKLAIIVEALNIKIVTDETNFELHSTNSTEITNQGTPKRKNSELKQNIIKNLESIINCEGESTKEEKPPKITQKVDREQMTMQSPDVHSARLKFEKQSEAFDKHINKYCNIYHDFDAHSEDYRSYLDFNWEDHAHYILCNHFANGVDAINNEIEYFTSLTTNSLGEEDRQLNTFPIRYSISCYIEKIFGYKHEDYNYSNVNKLLVVSYKKFIKNVACYPDRLTPEDFEMMNLTFNNEEIMHIIILVAVIKSRTQLTYFASSLYEIIKHID